MATTTYRGLEIINNNDGEWTIIDVNGSGHVETSLQDCKDTIDDWEECDRPSLEELSFDYGKEVSNPLGF